jgi:oligogalacturonide lyase
MGYCVRSGLVSVAVAAGVLALSLSAVRAAQDAAEARAPEPPLTWIDRDTGHRVVRLTHEPGSASLYFHQNAYTGDGQKMVYTTPSGLALLELATRTSRTVVSGDVKVIATGRRSQNVYYMKDGAVYATNVDSGATRRIGALPERGSVATVNADETLLAGTYLEGEGTVSQPDRARQTHPLDQPSDKGQMMERRLAARLPMALFTIDTRTGVTQTILKSTDWLNHVQFSPTDPGLLLLCHEGPWHKVERIWTVRADGSDLTKRHARTMEMEIFGHEFWSPDGRTIWYDLQTPRGEDFWLAGVEVDTGARTRYHLQRNEWSIHFNASPDGTLFAGDGGDERQVARATDGRWIYLFRPERLPNDGPADPSLIRPGVLRAERLVNMSSHRYQLEPNVTFTPDQKWVVFRSNMFGPTYVFAVEVAQAAAGVSEPAREPSR